jgi:hypothetical protein
MPGSDGPLRIQHPLVHVYVDDLGPAFDLLPRHLERRLVIAFEDQLGEAA